jgi:serine/threonine protein kinase
MSGELIGHRYRVLRKIGEGGMAVIHIAVDEKLGRDVAIKILKERYENHDEIRVRFQHEARAISAFDHPNILKIFDFSGEESKQLWLVTELIHGRNLAQILETTPNGWLHPVIAASIVREICRALQTAHEHGVVHRDVKPENVMITHHGGVKLMDFGIAKIQRITSMTQTGMFMGSPSYMSPEQIRGRDVDHRSDVYSLGVLFYELVTGKLPYTGSSTADVAMKILGGGYAHPRFVMAGIPSDIDSCIVSCMELLPENRPQTIDEIGALIDGLLQSMGLESSMQELERCFKDPKAYGDRLARILRVTEFKQAPTVIVPEPARSATSQPPAVSTESARKWNNEAISSPIPRPDISGENLPQGSTRRDHLLPARSMPHFSKRHHHPDVIAAHLPERRQQQRNTQMVKPTPSARPPQMPLPPRLKQANHQQRVAPQPPRREVRQVSRIVPVAPKKIHKVRYVVRNDYQHMDSGQTFGKAVAAILILIAAGIMWLGINRNALIHLKNTPAHIVKTKKEKLPSSDSKISSVGKASEPAVAQNAEILPQTLKKQESTTFSASNLASEKQEKVRPDDVQPSVIDSTRKSYSKVTKQSSGKTERPRAISSTDTVPKNTPAINGAKNSKAASLVNSSSPAIPAVSLRTFATQDTDDDPEEVPQATAIRKPKESEPKTPPTEPVSKAMISVASMPAAELYVDGRRHGTTNDLGTSSDWIEVSTGSHRIELKRTGYSGKTETISVGGSAKQRFGPYTLQRGESEQSKATSYRLTLSSNMTPAEVVIRNIETRAVQSMTLSQNQQTLNLERGIYEVTMKHNNDQRRRRIDLSGAAQQLTFSVEFRDAKTATSAKDEK